MSMFRKFRCAFAIPAAFIAAAFAVGSAAATGDAPQTPIRVLSPADQARYADIFARQEKGRWKSADDAIAKLDDNVLMGHVLYQRYMHPTAYRSSYGELRRWMAYYADHPEAAKIYRLAMKRRPKGASAPLRPVPRRWRANDEDNLHPDLKSDYARTNQSRLRRIEGRVRYLVKKEQATRALKELDVHLKSRVITERQYDRMRSWAAASLYYQGYVPTAKRLSEAVAARHGDVAVLSYWIAGLIAFREGDVAGAHEHFNAMARVEHQNDDLRAGAGFWAARTALAAGEAGRIAPNLEVAAAFPFTFYGQLALAQLGRAVDFDWTPPTIAAEDAAALMNNHKAVRRAVALAEVGRNAEAELELRWVNGAIENDEAVSLLAVAMTLNLPAAQLDIALAGGAPLEDLAPGLYPVPDYMPKNGFQTDRAVLYALMRQESKFKTEAKSSAGARGLMQLMPRTASYMARDKSLHWRSGRDRLYEPGLNMQIGQQYVNHLLDQYTEGDLFKVAVAYNGGPGNLRRWDRKLSVDDPLLFIESIPNPESRDYVEKVLTNVWVYRARLGQSAPTRDKVAAGALPVYEALDQLAD